MGTASWELLKDDYLVMGNIMVRSKWICLQNAGEDDLIPSGSQDPNCSGSNP